MRQRKEGPVKVCVPSELQRRQGISMIWDFREEGNARGDGKQVFDKQVSVCWVIFNKVTQRKQKGLSRFLPIRYSFISNYNYLC